LNVPPVAKLNMKPLIILLLMEMAEVTAPVLEICKWVPEVALVELPTKELLLIFRVAAEAELKMPTNAPEVDVAYVQLVIRLFEILIALFEAVAPDALSMGHIDDVVAPDFKVMVLLLTVAFALCAVPRVTPLRIFTWLTPEPVLLLIVLYDTLRPYWFNVLTPLAGNVAAAAPPKFMIMLPVAELEPPISFPVSPFVKGLVAKKPIIEMPMLQF
jgi:hypothetical protein